jgi:mono/diheme cytochrome c family protein
MFRISVLLTLLIALAAFMLVADDQPKIKSVPTKYTSPNSGAEMYMEYCAVCHGKDGKGNGPATPALKTLPTNLATLALRNGGVFPEMRVISSIKGDIVLTAHGSKDMPVWGSVLSGVSRDDAALIQLRIYNLTNYIKSLQLAR